MPKFSARPITPSGLRTSAEELIRQGKAPASRGWPAGSTALTLLHEMACSPLTASDALKLLHELQVHQIELDLQQEQAEADRLLLGGAQQQADTLFKLAPFAYVTLTPAGQLAQANLEAMAWLGASSQAELLGTALGQHLAPAAELALEQALARLRQGSQLETFAAQAHDGGAAQPARARATPDGTQILMAWMPTTLLP